MQVNKIKLIILLIIITVLERCVDPFYPNIFDNQQSLVIDGLITDQEGYHYIRISRSAPYNNPTNIPEQDCQVEVVDKAGNRIQFYESEPGLYEQWIEQEYLKIGNQYKLNIITTSGTYESQYETLLPCPPIENIYYEIEMKETSDPRFPIYGIQFYTDLFASGEYAKNYRWELEETWEYRATYYISLYIDVNKNFVNLGYASDSLYYCWSTEPIPEIYTETLNHINKDSLSRIPLRFVSNETKRLKVKYSLLVKQYSLSDTAYQYWDQLKKQSQETGGLYEIQPAQIRGNIYNVKDNEEIVLGFFNVSALTEKRIFVSERFDFFPLIVECEPQDLLGGIPTNRLPVYLIMTDHGIKTAQNHCFDCRVSGGTIEKPDFWE